MNRLDQDFRQLFIRREEGAICRSKNLTVIARPSLIPSLRPGLSCTNHKQMNTTDVWFGCSLTPQPLFGKFIQNRSEPKSLKLHASPVDFPLASKIIVRNLSLSTTESSLRNEFSTYGQVAEVKLFVDEATKRSKGYASVQYTCQDDAILALESMDHKYVDGRLIFVELAKPKPGHNAFHGYPKTCGPPPPEKVSVPSQKKEEKDLCSEPR